MNIQHEITTKEIYIHHDGDYPLLKKDLEKIVRKKAKEGWSLTSVDIHPLTSDPLAMMSSIPDEVGFGVTLKFSLTSELWG